ncbi:hypothetical protein C2E23DRAFT_889996 [Lenzites betulinus]|nr:hypothetical protein C2E23DRAFT_889996 [Lenzites betulinus]
MNNLPLETLQHILELACTDGGPTGNSLSLTSKSIRAAAHRVRFHSLRLFADRLSFKDHVAYFEREWDRVDGGRPRVRHLFITLGGRDLWDLSPDPTPWQPPQSHTASSESTDNPIHTDIATSPGRGINPATLSSLGIRIEEADKDTVRKLFQLVAADLWSLVVQAGPAAALHPHTRSSVFEHTFPLVQEVTFLGLCPPARPPATDAKPRSVTFPAATRLHLTRDAHRRRLYLDKWSTLAPGVTHLRVANLQHPGHVRELAEAIGVPFEPRRPPPEPPRTYPTIRHLAMEGCTRLLDRDDRGNFSSINDLIAIEFQQIKRTCNAPDWNGGVTAVSLPEYSYVTQVEREREYVPEWVEQINDGDMWWPAS